MKGTWRTVGTLALAGILLLGTSLPVSAEEVTPAGYHVYDVQEEEVSDAWYGIARGTYLKAGIAKLTHDENPAYALCAGNTLAHQTSDRVYARIYLDRSETGTGGWGTIDYWTGEAFEASMVAASSGAYRITRDKYYRVTGVHSVTEGELTETTMTCTNALYFD